jgi:3-isopropylmalate/(R)-2-methylmalate dehydratase small subunit
MIKGKVHKYGANVDTDAIIPHRYLDSSDPAQFARYCMAGIDKAFGERVQAGDMIVATSNFGCGSAREHAALSIKTCGISCIIANSFARIFYRSAINIGLPLLECEDAVSHTDEGDILEVDIFSGEIRNLTKNMIFKAKPFPPFFADVIKSGGLIEYTKKRLASGSNR